MFFQILEVLYQFVFCTIGFIFLGIFIVESIRAFWKCFRSSKEQPEKVKIEGPALDVIGEVCEEICDSYCKFREAYPENDAEHPPRCHNCPLNKIL